MGRFFRALLRLPDRRRMDLIPRVPDERRRHTMSEATARLDEAVNAFTDSVTLSPERVKELLRCLEKK